jgi:hypothetical protein
MNMFAWLALISYALAFLIVVAFSTAYLKRSDFMPYHGIAIDRRWSEVEPRMQVLLLALIKVAGSAWLALALAGIFLLCLLFSRNGELTQLIVFQLFCLIAVTPPVAVAAYVRKKTNAPTPVRSGSLVVLLTLFGFTFAVLSGRYV